MNYELQTMKMKAIVILHITSEENLEIFLSEL